MVELLVGPVVGKVTATVARILVETSSAVEVVCRLVTGDERHETSVRTKAKQPVVLVFEGLTPGTEYSAEWRGVDSPVPCTVRTPERIPSAMNVGAVSCNWLNKKGRVNLWERLRDHYVEGSTGRLDLLLHLGDQIYGDGAFELGLGAIRDRRADLSRPQTRLRNAIEESFRKLYRFHWRDGATRRVLAQTSNLMIWDDHEIRDDWGSRAEDRDPKSPEWFVGSCARRVYQEYQRQLWGDVEIESEREHHFHTWGPFGALFVDQRGARSFFHDPRRPYLGETQWAEILDALSEGGTFTDVQALLVVTSVPLAYLGPNVTTSQASKGRDPYDDLLDHWSHKLHAKEQVEFLRALARWKRAGEGRDILVLGGDVHFGGQSEIRHRGETVFRQLITSPITNKPPGFWAHMAMNALLEGDQDLGSSYSFEHGWFTNERNFGFVMLRHDAERGTLIRPSLITE